MKYFSTFSGIGGFELGIQQANDICPHKISQEDGYCHRCFDRKLNPPECVGYSEIDKYATEIYQKHFPNHKNYGDITKINEKELPDFDLLVGEFPCQSFSIAGKRGGFDDTRGTMFFEIARIIREKQPRLLLLENVKGLLSHDKGATFYTIISTLDELGYDCRWQVLNSKNHGVPQNRERVFIIGHLRGTSRPEVFPFGEADTQNSKSRVNGKDVSYCLDANYYKGFTDHHVKRCLRQGIVVVQEATKKGFAEAREDDSINLSVPNSKTRPGRVGTGMQQHTLQDTKIRRLTPTECERLQGFPDGWTDGVSDTQRYKTLGNAVTVNVIADIMEKLL